MQTRKDKEILAKTVYGEARGSTDLDRFAVACVIRNRAKIGAKYHQLNYRAHPLFGSGKLSEVCLKPYQFSCWNKNDLNYNILTQLDIKDALETDQAFQKCYAVAEQIVDEFHTLKDITDGSTHFHTKRMSWPKAWGRQKPFTIEIGAHLYYNNIE